VETSRRVVRHKSAVADFIAPVELDTSAGAPSLPIDDRIADAFDQHHAELYAYLCRVVGDAEAPDLVAKAFVRLFHHQHGGRWPAEPRTWLFQAATSLAIDGGSRRGTVLRRVRRGGRRVRRSLPPAQFPDGSQTKRSQVVETALRNLPVEHRAALLLSGEGFDGPSIALAIGQSREATRSILVQSRSWLRRLLEPGDGTP
jgi:DNA-directed RNA polymerase specialized sigma24 family protein